MASATAEPQAQLDYDGLAEALKQTLLRFLVSSSLMSESNMTDRYFETDGIWGLADHTSKIIQHIHETRTGTDWIGDDGAMCLAIITTGLEYTFRYWHNWTEVEEARLIAILHRILAEAAQRGAVGAIKDSGDADEVSAEVTEQAAEAMVAAARPVEAQVEAVVGKPKTELSTTAIKEKSVPRALDETKVPAAHSTSKLIDIREALLCVWKLTVSEYESEWINSIAVVLYALALPSLQVILAHIVAFTLFWFDPKAPKGVEVTEETPLLPKRKQPFRRRVWRALIWLVSVLVLGGTWALATDRASRNTAGEIALSNALTCGYWGLRTDANDNVLNEDALEQGSKEARARQYARDCYGSRTADGPNQCRVFKEPHIGTLEILVNQPCPFVEGKYCEGSERTARIFTTGLVDAKLLGINADRTPMLNRTTMCVPLNINAGFVQKPSNDSSIGAWEYYLGPKGDHNETEYTFRQFGDPFDFDVRSYTMSTYAHEYGKSWEQNYWHPRAELAIRKGFTTKFNPHALTIMFVNSCRLFYQKASDDSIFPAQTRRPDGLYANYDSRARPLACIDWIELCTREGKCAHPSVADNDIDMPHVFTRYAMNKSTSYDSIFARGASALDAQSRIRGDVSLPLSESPPQWAVESEAIFQTSLARMQYDAFDIASGAGSDRLDIYEETLPPAFRGSKSCKLFAFQLPKGYHNLGFVQMILVQLLLPLGIFLLGFETDQDFSADKQESGRFEDSKVTYFDWAWVPAGHLLSWLSRSADNSNASAEPHRGRGHSARLSSGDGQSQHSYQSIDAPARAGLSGQDSPPQAPALQRLDEEVPGTQRASEASLTGQPTVPESTAPEAPNLQPPSCTTASTGLSAAQELKRPAPARTQARTLQQQTLKQMFSRQGQSEYATAQRRT
ncbi:hypothetical protein B0A48_15368 [Cryoendolithus antarcticus]|uniref:Uncharacterized protein n=1 Tax=Cryoendolithus antarcticus TaxID=1507870 RepID=A0A1V8SHT4_9PEZI|nr:hypothetical protein B0A48_15368 [Cryoendolithus antarcticus]